MRSPARAPITKRAGSFSTCPNPSASSVGLTSTNKNTDGRAMASTRRNIAPASSMEPSLTLINRKCQCTVPLGSP